MRKINTLILLLSATLSLSAQSVDVTFVRGGGKSETKTVKPEKISPNTYRLKIAASEIPSDIERLELTPDFARAKVGDAGYFILPNGALTKFLDRKDGKVEIKRGHMAFVGSKTPAGTYASIIKGMPYFFSAKNAKKEDSYSQTVFFDFKNLKPYADVLIDYVKLEGGDANYSGMARAYRKYKLESGAVKPLSEKIKEKPALKYCVYAPEIRVRQGWKPAPPKVIHQTVENEPEMKVVVTFDRVGDIVRELKRQGVDKAEICLVGWNKSGHDGRYPQMFPVEPKLGGEAKLRELIKNTLADGYQITCHTNSTDAYEIADVWDEEYIIKKPDGSLQKNPTPWSGGEMYDVCWKRAYERFGAHDLAKVADLGFKGMHYIDVSTCVPARECFDPKHPTTPEEASSYMNKIFEYCNKTFGGAMSEGSYDHGFSVVDSILYVSFALGRDKPYPYWDDLVPVWPIVYHGIVLYNPGPYTINHAIKDAKTQLKFAEFGGRPSFYFHSKFREGSSNWMGNDDITCETDEKLAHDVSKIKQAYDEYKKLARLQLLFMESHEQIADGVYSTVYSDGTEMVSNYSDKPFTHKGVSVPSLGYKVFEK